MNTKHSSEFTTGQLMAAILLNILLILLSYMAFETAYQIHHNTNGILSSGLLVRIK
jgi:cell shape-determining protein MreD